MAASTITFAALLPSVVLYRGAIAYARSERKRSDSPLDRLDRLRRDRHRRVRRQCPRHDRAVDDEQPGMDGARIGRLLAAIVDLAELVDHAFGHRRADAAA